MSDKMYFNQKIIVINNRWGARRHFLHKQRVFIFHVVKHNVVVLFAGVWVERAADESVRIAVHPNIEKKYLPIATIY